jgi:hypothetical protein
MANIIDEILNLPFQKRTFEDRLRIKFVGRPTPDINIIHNDGKKIDHLGGSGIIDILG